MVSSWFRKILSENGVIGATFLLNSIIFTLYYFNQNKLPVKILIFTFGILLFFQFKTTNIKNAYSFTPAELDLQITRMNYFPPSLARMGYILERKREVKILERVTEKFIEVVDFNQYFPDYFSYLALPFFLIGIFWFVKRDFAVISKSVLRVISKLLLLTIIVLSLIGVNGKYGPFLFFPFIILFICIGIYGLLIKNGYYE
jgi:hypothetical protein